MVTAPTSGRRARRPPVHVRVVGHALRDRLQPLLPGQGRGHPRRPGVLPGPRLARHLRPRLPRGPPRRGSARPLPPRRVGGHGLSSYPHPRRMPSSGSSRPSRWASARSPRSTRPASPATSSIAARRTSRLEVWAFLGDGEMDEPEALGALGLAGREHLDNLIFVVNCNLQRLDGPVRGNGKIIQELESTFRGRRLERDQGGLGRRWDDLLARDVDGVLLDEHERGPPTATSRSTHVETGAYIREQFFGTDPRSKLVAHLSDEELEACPGAATTTSRSTPPTRPPSSTRDSPQSILAKTVKGWALGRRRRVAQRHPPDQEDDLGASWCVPRPARAADVSPTRHSTRTSRRTCAPTSPEESATCWSGARRSAARCPSGSSATRRWPSRTARWRRVRRRLGRPVEFSTTTAFARLLRTLIRDPGIGRRIVPIVPDEARTFGMDALFTEFKIYAPDRPALQPVDAEMMLSYKEAPTGQILEEGITEAGAMAVLHRRGHRLRHPRRADDARSTSSTRCSASSGSETPSGSSATLGQGLSARGHRGPHHAAGEGLQHQDGHSRCSPRPSRTSGPTTRPSPTRSPSSSARHRGDVRRRPEDLFYYLTLYNENTVQPAMPAGSEQGIIDGLYCFRPAPVLEKKKKGKKKAKGRQATILFSGSAAVEAQRAADVLEAEHGVGVALYSATSYKALREEALATLAADPSATPLVARILADAPGPLVAVSDYVSRSPPDRPLPRSAAHGARHRRCRHVRHPRGAPSPLRHRR